MRTRMLRLTATAGATALLAGAGALATAGSASAATSAKTTGAVAAHFPHHHDGDEVCWSPPVPLGHMPVLICEDHEGLLDGLIDALLG